MSRVGKKIKKSRFSLKIYSEVFFLQFSLPIFFLLNFLGPKCPINWVEEPKAQVPSHSQELEGGLHSDPNF